MVPRRRRGRVLAGQRGGRRHRGVRRRRAAHRSRRCTRCASSSRAAKAAPTWRSPISSRRAGTPTTSAPSSSPPGSARTWSRIASSMPTTTTRRSWSRRWPTVWPKPFAERLHQRVRKELWGYAADERAEQRRSDREKYRGIRPAPGYPAQPDHTEKATLFRLLDGERAGVRLTESFAMWPGASVCGLYFGHPDSDISASARSSATRSRTMRGARAGRSPRPSGGWRRSSTTIRSLRPATWRPERPRTNKYTGGLEPSGVGCWPFDGVWS